MNDDELDARLRAWGLAGRDLGPQIRMPAGAVGLARHRSRLLPALAGAAVVLAVAGGITAVQLSSSGGGHQVAPGTGAGSAAGTNDAPPVPAGTQRVVFHGLAIDVPAGWPLNATSCGTPQGDTVVLPGAVLACLSASHPSVTSVEFKDSDRFQADGKAGSAISVGGKAASRLTGFLGNGMYVVTVSVPSLSAQVVITSPKQTEAEALAATLTVVSADQNGCSAQDAGLGALPIPRGSARDGADRELVPGAPTDVTICRYVGGWIEQSTTLDGSQQAALVSLLNGLPPGLSRADSSTYDPKLCRRPATSPGSVSGETASDSEAYLIQASYPSGPSVDVAVRLGLCGNLGASNGSRTGQRTQALGMQLGKLAGESVGWPGDVHPVNAPEAGAQPATPGPNETAGESPTATGSGKCASGGGFALSLVKDSGGSATPEAAAVWFEEHGGVPGYGTAGTQWTRQPDDQGVKLTSTDGSVWLHVWKLTDDTWAVDAGGRCG